MWQSVGGLFSNQPKVVDESDLRQLVNLFFQDKLATDVVRCESVYEGKLVVRCASPLYQQEVRLLEIDLEEYLTQEADYKMEKLVVRR